MSAVQIQQVLEAVPALRVVIQVGLGIIIVIPSATTKTATLMTATVISIIGILNVMSITHIGLAMDVVKAMHRTIPKNAGLMEETAFSYRIEQFSE